MENKLSKNEDLKYDLVELFCEKENNIEIETQSLKFLSHPARFRIMYVLPNVKQTMQNLESYTFIM